MDTKGPITADYHQGSLDGKSQSWPLEGKTLDISGSGVLTILPEEPLNKHKIELKLGLNVGKDVVTCTGLYYTYKTSAERTLSGCLLF